MRLKFAFSACVLAGAFAAMSSSALAADCPSRIGVVLPMTGPIASVAQGMLNAARLAAEEINEAGGAAGCPVELALRDSQGQPSLAVDAARQVIDLEKARIVVGEALSGTTLAVLQSVTAPAGIPLISPTASSPGFSVIGKETGLFFRANISDALQGVAAAHYAMEQQSGTVDILAVNNDWGQNLSRLFQESYEALGGKVGKVVLYTPDQSSYRSEVSSLISSAPDTLYLIGYVTEGSRIVREWISEGGTPKLLFAHNLNDAEFVKAVGPQYLKEAAWLTPGASETPSLENFRTAYSAKFNQEAEGPGRSNTYDSIVVAALAIEAAKGAADGKAIAEGIRKVTDPEGEVIYAGVDGFKTALAALKEGKSVNYVGAVGPLNFDPSGDIAGAFVTWKLNDQDALAVVDEMTVDEVQALREKLSAQ